MACRVWSIERLRQDYTVGQMFTMLYPIPPKLFAKSKRNSTWKVHLYFHGMQEVIFCCTYALFISLAIIVLFYFFFSLSMAGQGKGRGRGRGSKMPLSQGDGKDRP